MRKDVEMGNLSLLQLLLIFALIFLPPAANAQNSCVECHKKSETISSLPSWQQDDYANWYGSVHGAKNVTCERCHGGDAAQQKKEPAHKNIKNSSSPESPIYYKNVPETCKACHEQVYEYFVKSKHFQNLKENRLAPTCTTCHGLHMSIPRVNPLEIAAKCQLCHSLETRVRPEVPLEARDALMLISTTENAIIRAQYMADLARERGKDVSKVEADIKLSQERLKNSRYKWHAFDLAAFKQELTDASYSANNAYFSAKSSLAEAPAAPAPAKGICGSAALVLLTVLPLLRTTSKGGE